MLALLYRLIPEEERHLPHFLNIKAKLTTNDVYQGTTISTGFGVSCILAEIHGEIGYSWVYGFNIYDEMNNIYNMITSY